MGDVGMRRRVAGGMLASLFALGLSTGCATSATATVTTETTPKPLGARLRENMKAAVDRVASLGRASKEKAAAAAARTDEATAGARAKAASMAATLEVPDRTGNPKYDGFFDTVGGFKTDVGAITASVDKAIEGLTAALEVKSVMTLGPALKELRGGLVKKITITVTKVEGAIEIKIARKKRAKLTDREEAILGAITGVLDVFLPLPGRLKDIGARSADLGVEAVALAKAAKDDFSGKAGLTVLPSLLRGLGGAKKDLAQAGLQVPVLLQKSQTLLVLLAATLAQAGS